MNLIPFAFQNSPIRVVELDSVPFFVAKDVAVALGYTNTAQALQDHCRGVSKRYPIEDALGRMQETRVISEPDVMRLVVGCTLPAAERFERWVFEEVLPSIRKTGAYAMVAAPTAPANPYQLTAEEAEQVAVLGNVAAAFMAEVSGLLYSTFERAQESGLTAAAANKYAVAIANVRMRELEKFRKERQEALVRAQKHTDKAVSTVSARLHKQLDTEELTVDEYLEKISHARRVLVNSGKQLLLS